MSGPIITTENLSHTYQPGPLAYPALIEISITVAPGSCTAIAGVTGSGKSTLVQHFNGLLRPTSGRVIVAGHDVAARGTDLRALRRTVGMLFQFPEAQLFAPTLLADVMFGPRRAGLSQPEAAARALAALDLVGLPPQQYAMRAPFELSGGQRRRAALAGVLALEPRVLVLDEPTVGLDAAGRAEFYRYIRAVRQARGVTVVLVSHDMAEVAALADWLVLLRDGRLAVQGPPAALFADAAQLRACGLAAPPLFELLAQLRQLGLAVPAGVATVEQALAALRRR
ncbi:MAG: energy-coupling factor transporter ATPase [Kouleothrix sp.]|jgi:energy-coupling factor transport system ATP-binding protein|nr:energy-coupling factor transporter ATPase [Kouleothrix sp.]